MSVEKRSLDETVCNAKHVLLDIEGTTTSISFVKDTLFPYVRKSLESYVSSNWEKDDFKTVLDLLKEQANADIESKVDGAVAIPSEGSVDEQQAAVVSNVLWQMDLDRKTTALKQLQGLVWKLGYKDGELKGHVYPDVAPALKRWSKSGRKLYIYSSGSVEAQKLLFKHSQEGDLSELFSGHFDTTIGPKVDAASYKAIVKSLDCNPDNVIFLTDVPKEASAAREAGLAVLLVSRDDTEKLTAEEKAEFSSVTTLEDVVFDAPAPVAKRQKIDEGKETKKALNGEEKMEVEEKSEATPKTEEKQKGTEEAMEVVKPEDGEKEAGKEDQEEKVMQTDAAEKVKPAEKSETSKIAEVKDDAEEKKASEDAKTETKEKVSEDGDKKKDPVDEKKKVEKVDEKKEKEEKKEVADKKDDIAEEKVDKKDEVSEEKTKDKVAEEKKKDEISEEKVDKKDEISEETKKDEISEEKKKDEISEEKKKDEISGGKKKDEISEKKVDKKDEISEEKKKDEISEGKKDEILEEKASEAKAVESKETKKVDKDEASKEEKVEAEVSKQNGVEEGEAVNGVSNGKTEQNGVNGKEVEKPDEIVVKKTATPAEPEVAAEA